MKMQIIACIVLLVALLSAGYSYYLYWPCYEAYINWDSSAHYSHALAMAHAIKKLNFLEFFRGIEGARQWPPFFSFLQIPFILIIGYDFRIATLPSLLCFAGSCLLIFLITSLLTESKWPWAGLLACFFFLTSQPYQHHALRILIESPGIFFVLLCIYFYLKNLEDKDRTRWMVPLGVSLSCLFLLKYNFWGFVMASLFIYEISSLSKEEKKQFIAWVFRPLSDRLVKLLFLAIILTFCAFLAFKTGILHGHRKVPVRLMYAIYIIFLVATLRWFTSSSKPWKGILYHYRLFILSGILPPLIWLAIPKKLEYFLMFLFENPGPGEFSPKTPYYYIASFIKQYNITPELACMVLVIALAGFFFVRRMKKGVGLVLLYLIIATVLTVIHPNKQSRHIIVTVAFYWIFASMTLDFFISRIPQVRMRIALLLVFFLALGVDTWNKVYCLYTKDHDTRHQESRESKYHILGVSSYYLPLCKGYSNITILSTSIIFSKHFLKWTFLEAYPNASEIPNTEIEKFLSDGPKEKNQIIFENWLKEDKSDLVILIDQKPDDPIKGYESYHQYAEFMKSQKRYRPFLEQSFPQSQTVITLYRSGN